MKVLFQSLTGDVMLDMLVGAAFAVAVYSSLAVVLLVATFTQLGLVSLPIAFGIVLGANLGSGALAMLSTMHGQSEARRVTLGNFLFKLAGCVLAIPLINRVLPLDEGLGIAAEQQVVYFHLAFNVAMAVLFLGLTNAAARIAERMLPTPPTTENGTRPRFLDASALDTPTLAIGNAARETLRIADTVEEMLRGMMDVLRNNDRDLGKRLRAKDDMVDELYTAVKLYLAQVPRGALDERESRRWADIISFAINLEQVGDIVERILDDIEHRKIDKGRSFSEAGMTEIVDLHTRLVANLRLATSVFLHGDRKSAQELLAQKVIIRDLERAYAASHLERLAGNTIESIETSSLHLDLISDLRRINSHFCSVAYPILEQAGVLAKTRLREFEDDHVPAEPAAPRSAEFGKDAPRSV